MRATLIALLFLGALVGAVPALVGLFLLRAWYRNLFSDHPWAWLRAKLGWGLGIDELARRLGLTVDELNGFQPSYREAWIPKRSGGKRRLLVPDVETKRLQRRILCRLLAKLRAHDASRGFERGRSIVDNAAPHVGAAVVVRFDVVDFFPTTKSTRIEAYFRRIGWNRVAAQWLTRLTTHEGGLPQGAPTSPRLSSLVNFGLDERFARYARRKRGQYTRYADDLTFSFPRDKGRRVRGLAQRVKRVLRTHGYELHTRKKWSVRRRSQRQVVTGLVVNERVQLPRSRRRWLRAVKHRFEIGRAATIGLAQLRGWLAFDAMVRTQAGAKSRAG